MPRRAAETQGPARAGRALVKAELERRGAVVRELRDGRVVWLEALGPGSIPRARVRVKSRRSGTWQMSASVGAADPPPSEPPAFWAFVDFTEQPPSVFVAPDSWVRRDVHDAHESYLARHGGHRAENDTSDHHALSADRIEQWRGRWDLLDVESPLGHGSDAGPLLPHGISAERHPDPIVRRCQRVLAAVHELHKMGYQRLRIVPGRSPSGIHWRCKITPVSNVLRTHGAMARDFEGLSANYTSGMSDDYFGWTDAKKDTARALAAKILGRFPELACAGRGRDWAYAGWYTEMLGFAARGELPVAYADWYEAPNPRCLPTTTGTESGLPMPPPGEAEPMDSDGDSETRGTEGHPARAGRSCGVGPTAARPGDSAVQS